MQELFLGIDTSCYTTSVAVVDEKSIVADRRTVLSVKLGERGLRQSDGVFQHIKNLENLMPGVLKSISVESIKAVGVSSRPRNEADSYMPVFLPGKTVAAAVAASIGVPLVEFSHQQGHVRAALFGNEELMSSAAIAMHISGGTTELLLMDEKMNLTVAGATEDLHAGQFVDRVGVAMGMRFPCGKEMELLASGNDGASTVRLPVSQKGSNCSFSGVESAAQRLITQGVDNRALAYAVYVCLADTFCGMLKDVSASSGIKTALISGGVASSNLLRKLMNDRIGKNIKLYFGRNELSSDNAVGTALLTMDEMGCTDGR